ncbi:MAG: rRNA maturation RNase YbeY [Patescibacteria group bacterium]|nr:rRNA maturation RNase YbeY [Patescibacteria group bacterium]
MKNEIRFEVLGKSLHAYKPLLVKKGAQLAKILKFKKPIDAFLVDSETMRKLNRKYRKKNKATNVLSFQAPLHFPTDTLGEIYLDPKYIEKKGEDLVFMLAHGVLHILGYDHIRERDRMKMERKEKQLLAKLNAKR